MNISKLWCIASNILIAFTMGACAKTISDHPPQATAATFLGVNLNGGQQTFSAAPLASELYAQVVITATLDPSNMWLKGPSAESDWKRAKSFFGFSELQTVSTSINLTINDLLLPTIIPFSFQYNSQNHSWEPRLFETYYSPWVLLDPNTKFVFQLQDFSAKSSNVDLASSLDFASAAGPALGGGAWTISSTAMPVLRTAANAIQGKFSTLLSNSVKNNYSTQMVPLADNIRSRVFHISDTQGANLLNLQVDIRLSNTLLKGGFNANPASNEDIAPSKMFDGDPNAIYKIQITGDASKKLIDELPGTEPWKNLSSVDVATFSGACSGLKALLLGTYNYNKIDTLVIMYEALQINSKYAVEPTLYQNKKCPRRCGRI